MVKAPQTYREVYARPSWSIWPGCGDGRCRSCGRVHDFGRLNARGQWEPRFACWYNYQRGCPQPIPEPEHVWEGGRCAFCGMKEPWVAPDGTQFRTLQEARTQGWQRKQLRRAGERGGP